MYVVIINDVAQVSTYIAKWISSGHFDTKFPTTVSCNDCPASMGLKLSLIIEM